jgi:hypothetical protein
MTERDFFTLRYALPGYTFILMIMLVAYHRLVELFPFMSGSPVDFTLVSAFVAFFTLLSGGAIGFLVSQLWYGLHNSILHGRFLKETRAFLRERFNLRENVHKEIIFLDYVFHLSDDKTIDYIQRRFDLKHTLGSTFLAIMVGAVFGVGIKTNLFRENLDITGALFYDLVVAIIIVLLLIILFIGFRFISNEHSLMVDVAVRKIVKNKGALNSNNKNELEVQDYFTKDYFKSDNNKTS